MVKKKITPNKVFKKEERTPWCLINKANKYIFIHIPKNASTTIRGMVQFDGNNAMVNYNNIKNPENYFKFIVIRNPVDRAISSYLEISKLRPDGNSNITRHSDWFKEPDKEKSFRMFLEYISKDNFYTIDRHASPQIDWIKNKNLTLDDMDVTLLNDTLDDDLNTMITTNKNIKTKRNNLVRMNVGKSGIKQKLKKFVAANVDVQDRIREIYAEDAKMYDELKKKQDEIL